MGGVKRKIGVFGWAGRIFDRCAASFSDARGEHKIGDGGQRGEIIIREPLDGVEKMCGNGGIVNDAGNGLSLKTNLWDFTIDDTGSFEAAKRDGNELAGL